MKQLLRNNQRKVLLLAFVLLFAGLCHCVSGAYAHYENEVSQQVVYTNTEKLYHWAFLEDTQMVEPWTQAYAEEESTSAESLTEVFGTLTVLQQMQEDGVVLLYLTYPTDCDAAILQFNGGDFPTGTIYSYNGEDGSELADAGAILLAKSHGSGVLLQMPSTGRLDIYYSCEGKQVSHDTVEVEDTEDPSWEVLETEGAPILGAGERLTWTFYSAIAGASFTAEAEYLCETGYQKVTWASADCPLTMTQDTDKNMITVSNPKTTGALAGTYKMRITCSQKLSDSQTVRMQTVEIPFFVNYR